ncbi:hypothetical protein C8F04DRAFT_1072484 [Mycena alexandri]|uniref:Phosphatidate phosphatase APP1 catalytic domain-containing protein n=1 Tax=Mycena alexandri TaxID=1745969 RepID=A0AAD6XCQ3_9AGAR|nr:hypothetical protein C8F04DRAFT_1072484 [Mycena alexandri]
MIPLCILALLTHVVASPTPIPGATPTSPLAAHAPPSRPTVFSSNPRVARRNVLTDLDGDINSILSGLGSAIPSYVASGVPNFFQDFPTGTAVASSLGLSDDDLAAIPTQVLNLPSYANWTEQGWSLLLHGNVFKQPNISQSKLDDLANGFLIGTNISSLPADQQTQARNLTAEIYVVQQPNVDVTMIVEPLTSAGKANGTSQTVAVGPTSPEGDFDSPVIVFNLDGVLQPGNATSTTQRLDLHVNGTDTGNATAYLVPTEGLTIISDIDDILRVTKIYEPAQGLLNSFASSIHPVDEHARNLRQLVQVSARYHFHYLTTTPEQVTRNYMQFIYATYPLGSFDTRPLNFSDVSATLSIRKFLLDRIFQTYPQRKFVLVADTSNSDVMKDYPQMVTDYPNQVQCIFLRNTSATDSGDKFPYDTSGFKGLNQSMYMFFTVPDDLKGLDITKQCYSSSVRQNVTFGEQGLPFENDASFLVPRTYTVLIVALLGVIGTFVGV